MKKTRILLSASTEALKQDVSEAEAFIRRINDCYLDRGHYFIPVISGRMSDGATSDAEIADCALAFFLVEPDGLPETYKIALNSYNKTGKPKIFTYVKIQGSGVRGHGPEEDGSSVVEAMQGESCFQHDEDAEPAPFSKGVARRAGGLPPSTLFDSRPYAHLDTLKLGILMQIKQLNLDGVDIRLEDGKAWQGDIALLTLDNVETISGFENLQKLKRSREDIESRYIEAKARYAENPGDPEAFDALAQATGQRAGAIGEIRDIEAQLYHMMEGMYVQTSQGKLSQRQAEAYNLVERGLLSEARDILDFYAIVGENRHREDVADRYAADAQISVNELLQLKDINAALLDWDGVGECYREAVRLEEKHNLPRNASVLYTEHLYYQNRHDEAIEIGVKVRRYYENPGSEAPEEEKSFLYNLLGILYSDTNRMSEAEEMLNASLDIRLRRTDGSLEWIEREIAGSYNGLGNLYIMQNRFAEAEEAHKKALEIRKKWTEVDPDAVEPSLAWTYVNLGALYNEDDEKTEEPIKLMGTARDIFKKLAVNKPEPNEGYLAQCYSHLGVSYTKLQRFDEAEQEFANALQLLSKLAGDNPDAYESWIAETYTDFANALFGAGRYQEALEKYNAALELYKKLSARSPDAFEPLEAKCHAGLAELYITAQRFADAETSLHTAIRLYDKHAETNPAYASSAVEARKALAELDAKQRRSYPRDGENPRGGEDTEFTPQEQEVALLLTDGESKSEIARKLHMNAGDVEIVIRAIRDKVVNIRERDPVIESIVKEYRLTRREADMLKYLRNNSGNDKIASELYISTETVKTHVWKMLKKLSVSNRQEIPRWLEEQSR